MEVVELTKKELQFGYGPQKTIFFLGMATQDKNCNSLQGDKLMDEMGK